VVETSRAEDRKIQDIHTFCCSHHNDSFIDAKTIHLYQKLVQGLFSLIVSAAHTSTSAACHGVNLIDENNTRRVCLSFREQITDTGCTDTYKHLHKVRTGNAEKRHSCL